MPSRVWKILAAVICFSGTAAIGEQPRILSLCTEKLNPRVAMVKSAQDGVRTYETGSLNRPRIRRIFV
jgi:hypothetical protein